MSDTWIDPTDENNPDNGIGEPYDSGGGDGGLDFSYLTDTNPSADPNAGNFSIPDYGPEDPNQYPQFFTDPFANEDTSNGSGGHGGSGGGGNSGGINIPLPGGSKGGSSSGGSGGPLDFLKNLFNQPGSGPATIGAIAALMSGLLKPRPKSFAGTAADPVGMLSDFKNQYGALRNTIGNQKFDFGDAVIPQLTDNFNGGGLPMNIGLDSGLTGVQRRQVGGSTPPVATPQDHQEMALALAMLGLPMSVGGLSGGGSVDDNAMTQQG